MHNKIIQSPIKIALVNPRTYYQKFPAEKAPLSILTLASILDDIREGSYMKNVWNSYLPDNKVHTVIEPVTKHFDVRIYDDALMQDRDEFLEFLSLFSPDIVGITMTTPQVLEGRKLLLQTKRFNSSITTIVGGPHVTLNHAQVFKEDLEQEAFIDMAFLGNASELFPLFMYEYACAQKDIERTIAQLPDLLRPDAPQIGKYYQGIFSPRTQQFLTNEKNKLAFSDVPLPSRSLNKLDIERYARTNFKLQRGKLHGVIGMVQTMRGCLNNCGFCSIKLLEHLDPKKGLEKRNIDKVFEEVYQYHEQGYRLIQFVDDTFTADMPRLFKVADFMGKVFPDMEWIFNLRLDKQFMTGLFKTLQERGKFAQKNDKKDPRLKDLVINENSFMAIDGINTEDEATQIVKDLVTYKFITVEGIPLPYYSHDLKYDIYQDSTQKRIRTILEEHQERLHLHMLDLFLEHLRTTGCTGFSIGVETFNDAVLQKIRKAVDLKLLSHITEQGRAIGIGVSWYLMVGLPDQTAEHIAETMKKIKKLKPSGIAPAILVPYKGTEMYNLRDTGELEFDDDALEGAYSTPEDANRNKQGENPPVVIRTKYMNEDEIANARLDLLEAFGSTTDHKLTIYQVGDMHTPGKKPIRQALGEIDSERKSDPKNSLILSVGDLAHDYNEGAIKRSVLREENLTEFMNNKDYFHLDNDNPYYENMTYLRTKYPLSDMLERIDEELSSPELIKTQWYKLSRLREIISTVNNKKTMNGIIDAIVPGNHEIFKENHTLDYTFHSLPWTSMNLFLKDELMFEPYRIFNRAGLNIAVLGISHFETSEMKLINKQLSILSFEETLVEVARLSQEIKKKADFYIFLTHIGIQNDKRLFDFLTENDLFEKKDFLIVGGHTHTRHPESGTLLNPDIPLIHAQDQLKYFGTGKITVNFHDKTSELISQINPHKTSKRIVWKMDMFYEEKDKKTSHSTKKTHQDFFRVSPLAGFVADLCCEEFNADITFLNGGLFRRSLPQGFSSKDPLIQNELEDYAREMAPFNDRIIQFYATREQLEQIAGQDILLLNQVRPDRIISKGLLSQKTFLQPSENMHYNIEQNLNGFKVTDFNILSKPSQGNKYKVVSTKTLRDVLSFDDFIEQGSYILEGAKIDAVDLDKYHQDGLGKKIIALLKEKGLLDNSTQEITRKFLEISREEFLYKVNVRWLAPDAREDLWQMLHRPHFGPIHEYILKWMKNEKFDPDTVGKDRSRYKRRKSFKDKRQPTSGI